ncbi:MAG TPA: DUF2846 domain-containing protein [Verrucomicrobiae bacterium]|nr:DUF2846 domain-containing protein [Verrucomicrobiae bacterium]
MNKTNFVAQCASFLLVLTAMAVLFTAPVSVAQESKTPAVLPAPSAGKAIVCIYRTYRFTGSATHDEVYVNGIHLGRLLNSEYEFMEVPPGAVIISGLAKVYYGSITMSAVAAINQATQKENERAHFEAEAGKIYYFKWTAGPMGTEVKVTPEDPSVGAKEIRKLHLSKPADDQDQAKQADKDAKPAAESAKADDAAKPAESAKPADAMQPDQTQPAKPN